MRILISTPEYLRRRSKGGSCRDDGSLASEWAEQAVQVSNQPRRNAYRCRRQGDPRRWSNGRAALAHIGCRLSTPSSSITRGAAQSWSRHTAVRRLRTVEVTIGRPGSGKSDRGLTQHDRPASTSAPQPSPVDGKRVSVHVRRLRRREPVDGVGDVLVTPPAAGRYARSAPRCAPSRPQRGGELVLDVSRRNGIYAN